MKNDKKKFKDTKVGKFLSEHAPNVLEIAGGALPDGGVLSAIGKAIQGDPGLSPELKLEFARLEAEYRASEFEAVSRRWEADMGSKYLLPHVVRPVSLILLLTAILTFTALDSAETVPFTVPSQWVDLLTTMGSAVFVAYFGGRSAEKIFTK